MTDIMDAADKLVDAKYGGWRMTIGGDLHTRMTRADLEGLLEDVQGGRLDHKDRLIELLKEELFILHVSFESLWKCCEEDPAPGFRLKIDLPSPPSSTSLAAPDDQSDDPTGSADPEREGDKTCGVCSETWSLCRCVLF